MQGTMFPMGMDGTEMFSARARKLIMSALDHNIVKRYLVSFNKKGYLMSLDVASLATSA